MLKNSCVHPYTANSIIAMYAKCGSMVDAQRLFDSLQRPDVVCCNTLILGYAVNGKGRPALELFFKMKEARGLVPNPATYVAALKACTSVAEAGEKTEGLRLGREIHLTIGAQLSRRVSNTLIDMYSKCGSMPEARRIFENMKDADVVSWNALLLGYAGNGEAETVLRLFFRMKTSCVPDSVTYIAALKACTYLAANGARHHHRVNILELGRKIHLEISSRLMTKFVENALIDMYAKSGSMLEARSVFNSISEPDVASWNSLLLGYTDNGEAQAALGLFSRMKAARKPDAVTYVVALKACTRLAADGEKDDAFARGKEILSEIGSLVDLHIQNTLIDLYAKCGCMPEARKVFDSVQKPDVVSWNALLRGYVENGEADVALDVFTRMKAAGVCRPNAGTYVAALKACASLAVNGAKEKALKRGREVHAGIGLELEVKVQNTLIDMYAKCGSMVEARKVFDAVESPDVISWNVLLMGYANNGEPHSALEMFSRMKLLRGCSLDTVTHIAALKACTTLALANDEGKEYSLRRGREIHSGLGSFCSDESVQTTLVDMYAKCGSMVEARSVFESVQKRSVAAWNALLLGYATNGEEREALGLFQRMKASKACSPSSVTYIAALKACSSLAAKERGYALERGREIHSEMADQRCQSVRNTLIDMYAKCGSTAEAQSVFESIQAPNVVSWNALLWGYAENREGQAAVDLFTRMAAPPDDVTYIAVLKACASIGALALGRKLHREMNEELVSRMVTSLVEFYARCGSLLEACQMFDSHPRARELSTWTSLLAGYSRFGDSSFVINLFDALRDAGLQPDTVAYLCMLVCCSHSGLVGKARGYLQEMSRQPATAPNVVHYTCMVDVLGRANQLNEAIEVIQRMPCNPDASTWMALLGACHKWKNAEVGCWAFQCLVDIDKTNAAAYVLMGHIYASCNLWDEQQRVLKLRGSLHRCCNPQNSS